MPRSLPQFAGPICKINSKINDLKSDLQDRRPCLVTIHSFFHQLCHDLRMVHGGKERAIQHFSCAFGSTLGIYNCKYRR